MAQMNSKSCIFTQMQGISYARCRMYTHGVFVSRKNVERHCSRYKRRIPMARSSSGEGNPVTLPFSSDPMADSDGRKIFILEEMTMDQLHDFHMRLCENDVEYHDLKSMCKLNGLGGKDMKYNLRAKLIRKVREMLGKPVWDRRSYGRRVKLPSAMTDMELAKFYKQREVVMPDDKEDAVGLAFAMLVVDGAISQDVVPTTSAYDKLNTKRLIQICQKRNLPTKGNKAELLARLVEYDAQRERKILADKAAEAARRELEQATIDVPPRPPNRAMAADLKEAQNTMASVSEMDLPYLRAALLARNLPVYGTSEVLIERLTNVLRRDVIDAHAGLGRMIKYAEAAVSKLNDEEIYEALAARGLASFSVGEDSGSRLANALVEEWIHAAMMPNTVDWESEEDQERLGSDLDDTSKASEEGPVDPTLNVTLLCDGFTESERERAIRSAREILPNLQSDQIWGTLMPFTSSTGEENLEDLDSFDCTEPPADDVEIMYLTPSVNGVVATLSLPLAPLGSIFRVYAKPTDGSEGATIVSSGLSQDIVVKGLIPGTAYEFTASIVNKIGEGRISDPYHAATLLRQGIAVSVLYPVVGTDGTKKYTELSWEELYGFDAGSLDSLLNLQASRKTLSPEDLDYGGNGIVVPLGHTTCSDLSDISALSIIDDHVSSPRAFRRVLLDSAVRNGFNSIPVLYLNSSNADESLDSWANRHSLDSVIGRFRVKVLDKDEPILSAVCRGLKTLKEVVGCIKIDTNNLQDTSVEIEPVFTQSVCVEVNVIATEKGPVALVPTEIDYFDINDYIEVSNIEIARMSYQNGDYDINMLERIVKLKREDVLIPATYDTRDKDLSHSRQIRHFTPPKSLSVQMMNHCRLSAIQVFNKMGFKDYAKVSLTISPEADKDELEKDAVSLLAFESGAKNVLDAEEKYTGIKVESFASLLEKEQTARDQIREVEKSLIDVHTTALKHVVNETESRYGSIFGIPLDGRTREDIKLERGPVSTRPIPKDPPAGAFEGVSDALSLSIEQTSFFVEDSIYQNIYVTDIDTVPDFESQVGILAQQLVATGLPSNWLPKQLVSLVADRRGLSRIQEASISVEELKDGDSNWVGVTPKDVDDVSSQEEGMSMEDIAAAIDSWENGKCTADELDTDDDTSKQCESEIAENEIEIALEQSVATLNEIDDMDSSEEETLADVSNSLAQQFPGLHPCRQRVWILCGGEGQQRDESLKAGSATMRALQGAPDLLLETFMLDPPNSGLRNDDRLKTMVSLREEILKSGGSDSFLFSEIPYLHPAQIKSPSTIPPQDLNGRGVWRLAGSSIVRETVEDMRCSIDRSSNAYKLTTVARSEGDDLHKIDQITSAARSALEDASILFDGSRAPWGGSLQGDGPETIPKYLSLKDWVVAASEKCAVVLMLLPGHPSAYGPIQELMDEIGVPYTGPSKIAADLCHERPELLRSLTDAVNYDGSIISAPPAHSISALELRATCQTEESAEEFFQRLFGGWENKMMVIRPATDCGIGLLRMGCGKDLMIYNEAIQNWYDLISCQDCAVEVEDVPMPLPPPTQFVIEPFLAAEPIQLVQSAKAGSGDVLEDKIYGKLSWNTKDNWLEVRGCLLGGAGTMRCLGLSTCINKFAEDGSVGSKFYVSPPPTSILSDETASDTMLRLQLVSDRLGLSGAAEISLLVNAATGEIVINEVDVHPDVTPNGLLMRQAALLSPPMSHVEVLRELLKEAMSRGEEGFDGDTTDNSSMYPAEEFSASMGGILDAPDAPNPTQNYFGDPYLKVEDGYQYGFEGYMESLDDESDDDVFDSDESEDDA